MDADDYVQLMGTKVPDDDLVWDAVRLMMRIGVNDPVSGHSALNFLRTAIKGRNIVLKYRDGETIKHLFINQHTLQRLRTLIINRGEIEFDDSKTSEYMKDFIFRPIEDLELYELELKYGKGGAKFEFINLSSYDLRRYQIYTLETLPSKDDHCLIRALQLQGVETRPISKYVTGHHFMRRDLSILAEKLQTNILLHTYKDHPKYPVKISKYPVSQKYPATAKIALHSNHYFLYEMTSIMIGNVNVTSLGLVQHLQATEMFQRHDFTCEDLPIDIPLHLIINEQKSFHLKEKPSKAPPVSISYADIECVTRPHHLPMMYGVYCRDKYVAVSRGADVDWTGLKSFLNSFPKGYNIVYFHNLKYDWSVIRSCPAINLQQVIRKDGLYYKIVFRYYGNKVFELRDSYKLIPKKLADFPKAFGLDSKKHEYILYELYTVENTKHDSVSYQDYQGESYEIAYDVTTEGYDRLLKPIEDPENYLLIDQRIVVNRKILSVCPQYFDLEGNYYHLAHCEYYLQGDCRLLKQGVETFRERMMKLIDIDCHHELTLPSMIHRRICLAGSYDGVYQLNDNLRDFVTKSVHGGRVCCKDNGLWDVRGRIYILDGKSLYPSAIERICREGGFPTGPCRVITDWTQMSTFSYYVVKINITKIGVSQQIPFVNYYRDESRIYTNEIPSEGYLNGVTVDKLTLEDWIAYQDIEFEFVEGVYWTGDGNPKLGELIRQLYAARQGYIAEGNTSMNEIVKLVLNSLYGKTIVKLTETKVVIKDRDKVSNYIAANFENLIDMENCYNQSILTVGKIGLGHENMAHVGGMILSMARRIMNEVMSLANDLAIHVLYQDTDSMHLVDTLDDDPTYVNKLAILEKEYQRIFHRDLMGEGLGQFGFDLKYPGHHTIYSERAMILGKKVYLHVVKGINDHGVEESYNYTRIKGVNSFALAEYPDTLDLYERLYGGASVAFDLTYGNAVMFKFTETSVTTRESYIRNISFEGERYTL
ncbi:DNA polymerase family B [uncultured virus]|nr:DNA polymerase family B [uncultured virus]